MSSASGGLEAVERLGRTCVIGTPDVQRRGERTDGR